MRMHRSTLLNALLAAIRIAEKNELAEGFTQPSAYLYTLKEAHEALSNDEDLELM